MIRKDHIITLLKCCAFLIFIGRAYQYLFFDAPFRAILWDDTIMPAIVEGVFNTPWNEYVTNATVDKWIQRSIKFNGILFLFAAVASLVINFQNKKYLKIPIVIGAFSLVVLSALTMKETFFHYGQFFEHTIQFGVPFILTIALSNSFPVNRIGNILKIFIAITFVSHGLYALGYYPVPGRFVDMTINATGVTEATARTFLLIAGILDVVLAILIFIPKISRYALLYAFAWGVLTASARLVANFNFEFFGYSLHQALYQVIYRLPHGLIPLLVYAMYFRIFNFNTTNKLTPNRPLAPIS